MLEICAPGIQNISFTLKVDVTTSLYRTKPARIKHNSTLTEKHIVTDGWIKIPVLRYLQPLNGQNMFSPVMS